MTMMRATFSSKLLIEGLRKVFFEWLDLKTLVYPQIYDVRTSTHEKEYDRTIAGIGMTSAKDEGDSITYDDFVDGYETTYTHTTYAKGLRITEELQEDMMYGVMAKRSQALANAARYRLEYDHASIFNYAEATTIFTGGDSKALLDTAHPLAGDNTATFGNEVASDLSLSALEGAFTNFRKMKNDRNLLVAIEPAVLLVSPELEFDAYEILNSTGKPYTADNEVNFFKGRLKVVVWDFLTATDSWFVLANKRYGAPISFTRAPVSFDRDGDFDTGDLKMKCRERHSFGFSDWRWVYGSQTN